MAVDTYGATVEGVNGLLPWDVDASDNPTPDDVTGFIEAGAAEVAGEIGALGGLDGSEAFTARARHLVHLYAAAFADDAAHPERIASVADDRYAATLWARYTDGLARLAADTGRARDVGDTGEGGAAHSFPTTPIFTRDMRF